MTGFDTLVVGLGSIGLRHVRVLERLGRRVATVSRRGGGTFPDIAAALARAAPDYVVIASETALHAAHIEALARLGYDGAVLVEKPLLAAPRALPQARFSRLLVGYNLRFHPVVARLREQVAEMRALTAVAYVGQHLADWRPGRDYRAASSASRAAGGGVLRDLSHELDLLLWLFGGWSRVAAAIGASGTLQIDAEDAASLLLELERCPAVSVTMNCLDRSPARFLRIVGEGTTIVADLVAATLTCGDKTETFSIDRDATYAAMHEAALADGAGVCTAREGLDVVDLIDAAERSVATGAWTVR
jgi:predicted dehydrogenase